MIILPAIDILGGKCVRLTKGIYETAEQVAADPIETALEFEAAGAEFIHMVDLDGAKEGSRINSDIYTQVAKKVHIPIEVGGGMRDCKLDVIVSPLPENVREIVEKAVRLYKEFKKTFNI